MAEEIPITHIPDLLHDAYLVFIRWNIKESTLDLYWGNCLIRNVDGTEIKDRTMLLRCTDIRGIAAGTEPLDCFVRPSTLPPPRDINTECLVEGINTSKSWNGSDSSWIKINDRKVEQEVFLSFRSALFSGTEKDITESPIQVIFNVPGGNVGAGDKYKVSILAGCSRLTVSNRNGVKDLNTWAAQYAAWWGGWKKHWEDKPIKDPVGYESTVEDVLIPGMKDEADPDYVPPQEPPFALSVHDVPDELIIPLRGWFEGVMKRDWLQMAQAMTWIDDVADYARWLSGVQPQSSWGYARAVDGWWQEEDHAVVTVRGIEHDAPSSDEPAESIERVWEFALRRRLGKWKVKSYAMSSPLYGSAPALKDSEKPWLADWHSGPIITKKKRG